MMERIQSGCLGCGTSLVVLGGLGLVSTFVDLGRSDRAIFVLFYELADSFGSVTKFSILTIGAGIFVILFYFLDEEIREINAEKERKKGARKDRSRDP